MVRHLKWRHLSTILMAVALILVFIFLFSSSLTGDSINPLTGNVVLGLKSVYSPNETLKGSVDIYLDEGELIPASSSFIVNMNGNNYDYVLSDLVDGEKISGDFYLKDVSISGNGEGYGEEGEKSVNFILSINSASEGKTNSGVGSGSDSENSAKGEKNSDSELNNSNEETPSENNNSNGSNENADSNEEETNSEVKIEEETPSENSPTETNNNGESNSEGDNLATTGNAINDNLDSENSDKELSNSNEEAQSDNSPSATESSEGSVEGSAGSESSSTSENSDSQVSPITGASIFARFFRPRISGNAVSENSNSKKEIKGSVKSSSQFEYELKEGESAELVSSDKPVSVVKEGNKVIVTLDESDAGFGKDYLGDEKYLVSINLSLLDIPMEEGDLEISLSYGGVEIKKVSAGLSAENSGEIAGSETIAENESLSNESLNNGSLNNNSILNESLVNATLSNESNLTIKKELVEDYILSEEELAVLKIKTGEDKVSVTKAEIIEGRLVIRSEIGSFWIENSYDSSRSQKELDALVSLDIAKWAKNLAKNLAEGDVQSSKADAFIGEYNLSVS